jgi:outer membrane protein OmpA-like peptidoglycan-associated protein
LACPDCGARQFGWRDADSGAWSGRGEESAGEDPGWIRAKFDSYYLGAPRTGRADAVFAARSYQLTPQSVHLSDIKRVKQPPERLSAGSAEPLVFPKLDSATIAHRDAEIGPERIYAADLYDLRLHDWDHASVEQEGSDAGTLVGRLWGTAYARLKPPPVSKAHEQDASQESSPTLPPPATPPSPESNSGQAQDPAAANERAAAAPGNPDHASTWLDRLNPIAGEVQAPNPAQHTDVAATIARYIPGASGWIGGAAQAKANDSVRGSASSAADNPAPENPTGAKGGNPGDRHRPGAMPFGRQASWRRLHRPASWLSWPFLLGLGLLAICLSLTALWPAVFWSIAALLVYRFLSRFQQGWFNRGSIPGLWGFVVAVLMVLLALLSLGYIISLLSTCRRVPLGWYFILPLLLALTGLYRCRVAALFVGALFIVSLLMLFARNPLGCGSGVAQLAHQTVSDLAKKIEQAPADQKGDADAAMAAVRGDGASGNRVSVDQALSNPNKYFSCDSAPSSNPYEIYFGESALFSFREAQLGPESETHLRKIAELLKNNPDAHVVLTGHTDKIGTPVSNLKLSEKRAQSVADWLVENGASSKDQIDVRGAGDRYPLVDDPSQFRLNRRVELRIDCSRNGEAGQ